MNKIKMLVVGIIMNCAGTEKSFLSWLSYYVSFGISADRPLMLDLGILQLTDGYVDFILDEYRSYYFIKAMDANI